MDAINEILDRKWVVGVGALIVGLALGLLYAWVINPVKWIDGEPEQMRSDLRQDYLRMAIDSYALNNNENLAVSRYQNLGEFASETLSDVGINPQTISSESLQNFRATVEIFEAEIPDQSSSSQPGGSGSGGGILDTLLGIVPWVCGIFGFLGLAGLGVFLVRRRVTSSSEPYPEPEYDDEMEYEPNDLDVRLVQSFGTSEEPIATFRTIYSLGDDLYDDSFSIEGPTGEFLGECGVGIGDIIGVGEPKKVSAFEVWLFDKNDIQTVTKVLMSDYAHSDDATRSRIATKGDPIPAESGGVVELATESLRLEARIVDLTYGEGALPSGSFFERIAIELRAWPSGF
jgi:hypothetical protein